jgi:type II secretory pathway pseudopilin PulG
MKRSLRLNVGGFTIIETIIVLAITTALLSSGLLLVQGRVPRVQFESAVNDLDVRIADSLNEVLSGYYPSAQNHKCVDGEIVPLDVTDTNTGPGTYGECIFIGQAIQFGNQSGSNGTCATSSPDEHCDTNIIYTVFGKRVGTSGDIATKLIDAEPKISKDYAKTSSTNGYGLHIVGVKTSNDGSSWTNNYGGVAFLQTFGTQVTDTQATGANKVEIVPLIGTSIGETTEDFVDKAKYNSLNPTQGLTSSIANQYGVKLCLKSASTTQVAIITLGEGGSLANNKKQIFNDSSDAEWSNVCL